ncbi:Ig-like domain-containing protein, partial [candidate division KSB1 bacterium]|nr:Ig-like domain-containing protein [candidate division KSB1 bacterium]
MSSFKNTSMFKTGLLMLSLVLISSSLWAQVTSEKKIQFKFTPSSMILEIGEVKTVKIELVDENGVVQNIPFTLRISGATRAARGAIDISTRGSETGGVLETQLRAINAGSFMLSAQFARRAADPGAELIQTAMPLEVAFPPLVRITFVDPPENVYEGTNINYITEVYDAADMLRNEVNVRLSSSNSTIASIDNYGNLTAHGTGTVTLTARAENITSTLSVRVVDNPVRRVELTSDMVEARTGDVFHFSAT